MTRSTSSDAGTAASWWDRQDDQRRAAITRLLDSSRGQNCRDYARDNEGFAAWLLVADVTCTKRFGVSIFDLVDWTWRDAYDSDTLPAAALREAIDYDGTFDPGCDAPA